jgi:hypothetical protein
MIKVSLINEPNVNAEDLIAFGARSCYQGEAPKLGEKMGIKSRLFDVGHHTTFQHGHYTFFIEGIAVGDITLGLHLANVFYNSSQRSGRFCSVMFANPNFEGVAEYIDSYYQLTKLDFMHIMDYLRTAYKIYSRNIGQAEELAKKFIQSERPCASEDYIQQNAPKIAQEQLRVFIPVILPTALTYTVNLSALAALYHVAWSPPLMDLTRQMTDLVLKQNPNLSFVFSRVNQDRENLPMSRKTFLPDGDICLKPTVRVISFGNPTNFKVPSAEDMWPIDSLPFNPAFMDNNTEEMKTLVEISLATMDQDQRHRTVRRGQPIFTGDFYLPPILAALKLKTEAWNLMKQWLKIFRHHSVPLALACSLAPYGAMVRYRKSASYNALAHEFFKRLCWCTQEEIYHASVQVVEEIIHRFGPTCSFLKAMKPPCAMTGVCGEGKRYCGRDISESVTNPFIERKV